MLPIISSLSLSDTQIIVLNIRNFFYLCGTNISYLCRALQEAQPERLWREDFDLFQASFSDNYNVPMPPMPPTCLLYTSPSPRD